MAAECQVGSLSERTPVRKCPASRSAASTPSTPASGFHHMSWRVWATAWGSNTHTGWPVNRRRSAAVSRMSVLLLVATTAPGAAKMVGTTSELVLPCRGAMTATITSSHPASSSGPAPVGPRSNRPNTMPASPAVMVRVGASARLARNRLAVWRRWGTVRARSWCAEARERCGASEAGCRPHHLPHTHPTSNSGATVSRPTRSHSRLGVAFGQVAAGLVRVSMISVADQSVGDQRRMLHQVAACPASHAALEAHTPTAARATITQVPTAVGGSGAAPARIGRPVMRWLHCSTGGRCRECWP